MNPYIEYQSTEYDWLPEVPKHWNKRYLFQVNDEQSISNKNIHHQNLLSLSYGNIIKKDINSTKGLLPESFDTYQVVHNENIILRLTDLQNDHKSLRVGLVTQTGIITSAYTCLKPKNVSSKFIHYLLHAYDLRKVFYGMGGGLRQSIGFKELKYIHLYIPPSLEQDQIVKFLDYKISKINKFIKEKKREIELLKELKQTEINRAVTKGLNLNVPMKNSGIDWLGEIPEHWEVIPLKQLVKSNIESLSNNTDPEFELSYIDISSVGFGYLKQNPENYKFKDAPSRARRIVHEGDIIISTVRTYLKSFCLITEETANNIVSTGFAVLTPFQDIDAKFLSYAFSADYFINSVIKNSIGISYPAISDLKLMSLKVILPNTKEEQKILVQKIELITKKIDKLTKAIEQEILLAQEFKTSLISDVVTGKVDVRNVEIDETFELETSDEIEAETEEVIEE